MTYGLGNDITRFKERSIDMDVPVEVYRNLNCKGVNYSVRQHGLVVAHTACLMLHNVTFKVSEKGKKRSRRLKQRNVHAFLKGKISMRGGMGTTAKLCEERDEIFPAVITYNPYTDEGFTCRNLTVDPIIVKGAICVIINKNGVSGTNISK